MESSVSTPFLTQFSFALVSTLLAKELLEVVSGREKHVVRYLAAYLHEKGKGNSLLSTVEKALLQCDDVDEFYADQETMKGIVETLKYGN